VKPSDSGLFSSLSRRFLAPFLAGPGRVKASGRYMMWAEFSNKDNKK
jgi:hypothetical protein